jgi:sugar/nucleoside kinase (ribokinase family)
MDRRVAVVPYDVLIPGHYFCDIIFSGIPGFPALGTELYTRGLTVVPGGVMNTVVSLTRLGVRVGWLSTLGNDFFSQFAAETARSEGVDLSLVASVDRPLKRVTVSLSYTDDRAFVTYVDPAPDLIPRLHETLAATPFRHLHFTGLLVDERVPDLMRACQARGITVSMDCQHREQTLEHPVVAAVLGGLDVFMPNASEARRLTGTDDTEQAAAILRRYVPCLVIKDGSNGAHAWQHDRYVHVAAINVEPVDTTGAGDVFNAGFLAARLQGKPLEDCLRWGNIAGGLSLRGHGGYSTSPTLAELHACLPPSGS